MKTLQIKTYSTVSTHYSTIGRRNLQIEAKIQDSGELTPIHGKAFKSFEAKRALNLLFN
jgi:hypothetical protein